MFVRSLGVAPDLSETAVIMRNDKLAIYWRAARAAKTRRGDRHIPVPPVYFPRHPAIRSPGFRGNAPGLPSRYRAFGISA